MKNKVYFGENQEHVKLYKKGKVWVASLVTLFSMGLGVGLSNAHAHAATTTNSSSATKVSNQVLANGTSTSSSSTTTSTTSSSTATSPAGSSSNSSSSSSSSTNSSSSSSSNTAQPISESGTFSKTSAYNSMSGDDCNSHNGVSANVSNSKHNGGSYQVSLTPVTGSTAASITVNISDWDSDAGNTITGLDGSATGNSNGAMIYQDAISFTINDGQIAYDSDVADGQQLMQEVIADIKSNWANGYKPLFTFAKNPNFNLAQFKGYTGTINITLNYTHGAVQQHNTITAKRPISAVFSNGQPAKVFNGKSNVTQTITFNSTEILDVTNSQPANVVTTPATQTMPSYPVPQIPGFTTTIVYAGEGSEISGGGNVSIVRAANDDSNTVVKEVDNVKPNQALPPVKVIYAAQNSQGTFPKGSNPNASVSGDNVNNGGSWTFSPLIPADASKDTITINFVDPNANRVITDDNGTISTTQSANGKTNIWSQTFDGNQLDPQQVANIIQTELQELWNQGYKPLFTVG
ncbi:MAG: KxYKxGKxW signal peptide domain-containing protein, partial [Firmicutes bacterium]|nr:KxYKxGKxW signal peptide domain-containing protein [Candidatus Gallilactobacillus intestinavium]